MYVAPGGHLVNSLKTIALQTPGQDYMGVEAMIVQLVYCGEDHSNLKSDARFRRRNLHAAAAVYHRAELFVEVDGTRTFPCKKLLNRITPTRMRHIHIDEGTPALGASPERSRGID